MTRLLFIDPVCPRSYDARALFDRALGETEASVVRVAEGLAQRGHRVTVAQCGRRWPSRSPGGVAYVPFDYYGRWDHLPSADAVVVLRQHKVLARVRKRFQDARLALWVHRTPGSKRRALGETAVATDATIVCVSDAHRAIVRDTLGATGRGARTARVHSPVDDALAPDDTPVDPDKLVVVAHRPDGLDEVLRAFGPVRARRPRARLYVAGCGSGPAPGLPNVVSLGPLPHREVVRHVRQAFAVFSPQAAAEDTFELGFAEANAVGTPVLAHPHPAAREVLAESPGERRQLVDARDPEAAARRLARWWDEGRPAVSTPPAFRTSRVVADWEHLLGVPRSQPNVRRTRRLAVA
ncbi:glycosyltransferase [Rubrivirga sp.]|uniref:glycosyltransferase n=1 Tax=Rubrivirga sp. TaxID=1885344 RepID=UPI003B52BAA3